jgi:replicative DNA helicase
LDIEKLYVSKLAHTGQIESAIEAGITPDHFADELQSEIYRFMGEHARKYKGAPSMAVIREKFPNVNFELPTDSLEYLKSRFVTHVKRHYAVQALHDLAEEIDKDETVENIDGYFLEQARRISQLMPSSKVHRFSDIENRIDAYEADPGINFGIKMGIPEFDKLTLGIQPHEFVSIVGWQGTGKSTLGGWILFNGWMQERTGMIISLEMEARALLRKWDTMLTNFEYRALKAHELSAEDLERWRLKAKMVKERKADIIIRDDVRSCTVDYVYAQIIRYQPEICVVDYVSLMESPHSTAQMWEKVTYLTQSLKQIARTTGVPIIGIAQTNIHSASGGAQLDNIAYSRSIGQDSDIVLGLHQDDEMKENKQMTVRMLKNRDGDTIETDLYWDMSHMRFGSWNELDLFRRREARKEALADEQ